MNIRGFIMVEHWIETIARKIEKEFREQELIIGNGGLSVSGLQHVGRLRGEITLVDTTLQVLKNKGYNIKHTLVLYTVDPWKGKETQLSQFKNRDEAREYIGRPLYMVPDPEGCHNNWVEHYWEDFGKYLEHFSHDITIITTQQLYEENDIMQNFIKKTIIEKEKIINTLNKYRKRKPYPLTYIPFEPICEKCGRIDTTEVFNVDLQNNVVEYTCKACGHKGKQSLTKGKLNWRLEWVGVWKSLNVSFEPYGKDHATPGGSRDSCNDLAVNIYKFKPPVGVPYEWVGYEKDNTDMGDMGSSDFIGFTPKEWIEVAEGEVLRYIYLVNQPMKRIILNMKKIPFYTEQFDRAERIYYGVEKSKLDSNTLELIKKSYKFALLREPPNQFQFQLPYLHAVALIQILPKDKDMINEAIRRLKITKYLDHEPTDIEIERIKRRLQLSKKWLEKYADERYKIHLLESITEEIISQISIETLPLLVKLYNELVKIQWTEENIKSAMIKVQGGKTKKEMFTAIYLMFFGKKYGPRIAPYFAIMEKNFVLKRFKECISMLKQ